jgi:outer membrane protein assembly factor BamA
METSNDSTGWGVGAKLYLSEDRHRTWFAYLDYDVNYDFFGVGQDAGDRGISIPLNQSGDYFNGVYLRRVGPSRYAGLRYRLNRTSLDLDWDALGLQPPTGPVWERIRDELLSVETASVGVMFQQDGRDNTIYPTRGTLIDFAVDRYDDAWGSDIEYWVYELAYNSYKSLGEDRVLASRFYARATDGDVPFWGLCQFGAHNDLRGYVSGQYRDRVMAAAQVEYRAKLKGRIGYVILAGIGQVAPKFPDFSINDLLWSAGVGLRIRVTKENPVNYRIDYAIGKEGGEVYFAVGEAF